MILKEEKEQKLSHNSKHLLLHNILSLACLYRDHEFYLPMFCDLEEDYILIILFSYQGNDLSRALLLFSNTEIINEKVRKL